MLNKFILYQMHQILQELRNYTISFSLLNFLCWHQPNGTLYHVQTDRVLTWIIPFWSVSDNRLLSKLLWGFFFPLCITVMDLSKVSFEERSPRLLQKQKRKRKQKKSSSQKNILLYIMISYIYIIFPKDNQSS